LNALFVRIFSFIGWLNFEHFFASHMRHHQYTLHPPEDGEVILPIRIIRWQFVRSAVVNIHGGIETVRPILQQAAGRFEGAWNERLFPADQADKRLPVTRWARALLAGHAILAAVSILEGWWLVPVVVSLTPWYGGWLFFLCNNTQHVGLQDRVPDFRMCCRTFMVNPLVQFLYWHMNFHTEHHMYAAVPCYHLAGLHRAIRYDLPHCSRGLRATWTEIAAILRRQQEDPGYQYAAPLPPTAAPARTQGYPPSIP
jgi:fatty acid desaturase